MPTIDWSNNRDAARHKRFGCRESDLFIAGRLYVAMLKAQDAQDFDASWDCFTPEANRKGVMFEVAMYFAPMPSGTRVATTKDTTKKLDAVARKYKLDEPLDPGESTKQWIERHVARLADLQGFSRDVRSAVGVRPPPKDWSPPELIDVKIDPDGEHALGTLVSKSADGTIRQLYKFAKIDGSWRIETESFWMAK